jgi:hypothetical protein
MLELIRMGQSLKSAAPAAVCALLEYCVVYGGNAAYGCNSRVTTVCCVISRKSTNLIYLAAEA